MKIEKKNCSNCGELNYIYHKGKQLCQFCNEARKNAFKLTKVKNKAKVHKEVESLLKVAKKANKPKKKPKRQRIKTLVDKLDRQFSKFIRRRDTDESGWGVCCTCGNAVHYNDGDCGHFITRQKKSTRFHEKNCNLQCKKCNRFSDGRQFEHSLFIDNKYTKGTAEEVYNLSRKEYKYDEQDLIDKVNHYKAEIKRMPKNFEI